MLSSCCIYEAVNSDPRQTKIANGPRLWEEPKKTKSRGKKRRVLAVHDDGKPRLSSNNGSLRPSSWRHVVSQVTAEPSSRTYVSDSSFMDSGTYSLVWYSSNHITSKRGHQEKDSPFLWAQNRSHKAYFGVERVCCRQTQFSFSLDTPPH